MTEIPVAFFEFGKIRNRYQNLMEKELLFSYKHNLIHSNFKRNKGQKIHKLRKPFSK